MNPMIQIGVDGESIGTLSGVLATNGNRLSVVEAELIR